MRSMEEEKGSGGKRMNLYFETEKLEVVAYTVDGLAGTDGEGWKPIVLKRGRDGKWSNESGGGR